MLCELCIALLICKQDIVLLCFMMGELDGEGGDGAV